MGFFPQPPCEQKGASFDAEISKKAANGKSAVVTRLRFAAVRLIVETCAGIRAREHGPEPAMRSSLYSELATFLTSGREPGDNHEFDRRKAGPPGELRRQHTDPFEAQQEMPSRAPAWPCPLSATSFALIGFEVSAPGHCSELQLNTPLERVDECAYRRAPAKA